MFETEDWNFDEEFLQDADEKALQFFSQAHNHRIEVPVKKRKLNIGDNSDLSLNNLEGSQNTGRNNAELHEDNSVKTCRKDFVLDMFRQHSQNKRDIQCKSKNDEQFNNLSKFCSKSNLNMLSSGKNIVLDILKKRNDTLQSANVSDNKYSLNKNIINSSKSFQELIRNKAPITNHKSTEQLMCSSLEKSQTYPQFKTNIINNNAFICAKTKGKQDSFKDRRRRLLLQNLKPATSFSASKTEKQINKKTLVRAFPGPAGLLPDIIDDSLSSISDLKDLDENEVTHSGRLRDTSLMQYCSQNTKNLFSEGPWKLMLDDLPDDFLIGYEIAEIKEVASTNCYQSIKIPFLAGIIESIDHSQKNPHVTLKDFTDIIEGVIHADIPLNYPGVLDKNVVLLLQNVGLLNISEVFIIPKYHVLISPSNVLGIYTHKGEIVRTSRMKLLLENIKNNVSMEEEDSEIECDMNKLRDGKYTFSKKSQHNTDADWDTDEFSLSTDLQEVTTSQNQKHFCNLESKNNVSENRKTTDKSPNKQELNNIAKTLKNVSYVSTAKTLSPLKKDSKANTEKTAETGNKENMNDNGTAIHTTNKNYIDTSINGNSSTNLTMISNIKKDKSEAVSIKAKLSSFRRNDALTPVESMDLNVQLLPTINRINTSEGKETLNRKCCFVGTLLNNSDDSDDELLSQLDVDNIE